MARARPNGSRGRCGQQTGRGLPAEQPDGPPRFVLPTLNAARRERWHTLTLPTRMKPGDVRNRADGFVRSRDLHAACLLLRGVRMTNHAPVRVRGRARFAQCVWLVVCAVGGIGCPANATNGTPDASEVRSGAAVQSGAGAGSASMLARDAGVSSDGGAAACRGPGRYEAGKEGSYQPCCAGLHEVPYAYSGYSDRGRVCTHPPLRVYACVRGECEDGICEEGEEPVCGCVPDCPQAVWGPDDETPSDGVDAGAIPDVLNAKVGFPDTCEMTTLASYLQQGESPRACGDLPLGASEAELQAAATCVRDAGADHQSFQIFWRSQGIDSIVYSGVIGTAEGDELRTISIDADAVTFGIDIQGAIASWGECSMVVQPECSGTFARCVSCERTGSRVCGCLPQGKRPGAMNGDRLEVRCEAR
jgi:hypothetical protein